MRKATIAIIALAILLTGMAACRKEEDLSGLPAPVIVPSISPNDSASSYDGIYRPPASPAETAAVAFVESVAAVESTPSVTTDNLEWHKEGILGLASHIESPFSMAPFIVAGHEPFHLGELIRSRGLLEIYGGHTLRAGSRLFAGEVLGIIDSATIDSMIEEGALQAKLHMTVETDVPLSDLLDDNTIAVAVDGREGLHIALVVVDPDKITIIPHVFPLPQGRREGAEADSDSKVALPADLPFYVGGEPQEPSSYSEDMAYYEINAEPGTTITVELGQRIGAVEGSVSWKSVFADEDITGNTVSSELIRLSVTRAEFVEVTDEIKERASYLVSHLGDLLDNDDRSGFMGIVRNDDRFPDDLFVDGGALDAAYRGRFDSWQSDAAGMFGAVRTVYFHTIKVVRPDTVLVTFTQHVTLVSGNEFTSILPQQLVLEHIGGTWYITNMSHTLFGYSSAEWEQAE
jgi:hypothetical protein